MKQKDLALIIVVVVISALISIFVSKQIFAPPKNRQQQVEVVQAIDASFKPADERFFNKTSFDPTRQITIGNSANPDPFNNSAQQ